MARAMAHPPSSRTEATVRASQGPMVSSFGHHAMAGTLSGFLDHTRSGRVGSRYASTTRRSVRSGWRLPTPGHFGVPLIMVTGDEAACREAEGVSPGLVTVPVKCGIGRNTACCVSPDLARARMREGASKGMAGAVGLPPKPAAARR